MMFPSEPPTVNSAMARGLRYVNSALIFWFFAFLVTGPKSSYATSALLVLSILTLPLSAGQLRTTLKRSAPWMLGIAIYCLYQIAHRIVDGGLGAQTDPPARFLGAIPIFVYLARYGFKIEALWAGLAAGCAIGGVAGVQEVIVNGAQRAGLGHHPIAYGSLLGLMGMSCLYAATIHRHMLWRAVLLAAAAIGIIGVLYSGTRGLYPALAACIAYIGYGVLKKRGLSCSTIIVATIASISLVSAIAWQLPSVQKRAQETLTEYKRLSQGNLETSIGHRIQMWHSGLFMVSQSPVFGLGLDTEKRKAVSLGFLKEHKYNPSVLTRYDHLHNLYLNEAAAFGLVGLATLLGLLFGAIRGTSPPYRGAIAVALILVAIEGLSEAVLNHNRLTMAFVILVTVLRAHSLTTPPQRPASKAT